MSWTLWPGVPTLGSAVNWPPLDLSYEQAFAWFTAPLVFSSVTRRASEGDYHAESVLSSYYRIGVWTLPNAEPSPEVKNIFRHAVAGYAWQSKVPLHIVKMALK